MKHAVIIPTLVLALIFTSFGFAQFRANTLGGGAAGGGLYGDTDFSDDAEVGLNWRLFVRHSFSNIVEAELGVTNGAQLRNDQYKTQLTPVDVRLLIRPLTAEYWSPYLYGGIGAVHQNIVIPAPNATADGDAGNWSAFVPVGAGVQFRATHNTSVELSGGYNLAFTDELDSFSEDADDRWFHVSLGLTMTGLDWNADPDMDGLTNRQEKELGTDGNLADTDADGLSDGAEVNTHASNPLASDSDEDGLTDSQEVKEFGSSPTRPDSDDDGLTDMAEAITYRTNPAASDTDDDGLTDKDELMTHKSDPLRADTDGDGLSDGREAGQTGTGILKVDSDEDGLSDGDEVNTHGTNPLAADSDGGSVDDGTEVGRGTNPMLDSDDIVLEIAEVGSAIVLEGIEFASGKAEINQRAAEILEKAYNTLRAYPDMVVEIQGHTDNTGSRTFNVRLSQNRAEAVRNYLIGKGVDEERVHARGVGPDTPIADNSTNDGRTRNRRIEFIRVE